MLRILGLALIVVVAVTIVDGALERQFAQDGAVEDASQLALVFARDVVQPALADSIASGNAADLAVFDVIVRNKVLSSDVSAVNLYRADGELVYSNDMSMIGRRYPLGTDELKLMETGGIRSGITDLTSPGNFHLHGSAPLLEVDIGVHTTTGSRLLLVTYFDYAAVTAHSDSLWMRFAAVTVCSVLLMLVCLVPLIRSLIRSLDRGRAQRQLLLERAIDASDSERRRIASQLHDGPVQDLVGAAYFIGAAGIRMEGTDAGPVLENAETTLRGTVDALRSFLLDIYPPALEESGLAVALNVLASGARRRGVTVSIDAGDGLRLTPQAKQLAYRVAREALANAIKHGDGTPVTVKVRREHRQTVLTVTDNGPGFDAEAFFAHPPAGHFGLQLLRDAVTGAEVNASLAVKSALGLGTSWRLTILN